MENKKQTIKESIMDWYGSTIYTTDSEIIKKKEKLKVADKIANTCAKIIIPTLSIFAISLIVMLALKWFPIWLTSLLSMSFGASFTAIVMFFYCVIKYDTNKFIDDFKNTKEFKTQAKRIETRIKKEIESKQRARAEEIVAIIESIGDKKLAQEKKVQQIIKLINNEKLKGRIEKC